MSLLVSKQLTRGMVQPMVRGSGAAPPAPTYATWSPTDKAAAFTLSNGDLTATMAGAGFNSLRANIGKLSGSGCFEITFNPDGAELFVGVGTASATLAGYFVGLDAFGWGYYSGAGKFNGGVQTVYGTAWNGTATMMVEVNVDAMTMEIFKSTVSQGTIDISNLTGPIFPMGSALLASSILTINCGQSPFSRTPTPGITPYWSADA